MNGFCLSFLHSERKAYFPEIWYIDFAGGVRDLCVFRRVVFPNSVYLYNYLIL